jgi:exodeoxyribonuclease III
MALSTNYGPYRAARIAKRPAGASREINLYVTMKIATFNINNVNKRLPNLLAWLRAAKPDVVCLQELKAAQAEFPKAAIEKAGYGAVWRGQKSWNGVAILGRDCEPVMTRDTLPGDAKDAQSRYIEAAVNEVLIGALYAPNGNPQPGPKFDYKLAWMERLARHANDLLAANVPVVLAGDYNVVPTDFDIYKTTSYKDNALLQPKPRSLFRRLLEQGWIDAVRKLHPDEPMFSYWSYMRNRWPRDAGLRLDVLLLSKPAAKRLQTAGVDRTVRGKPNASDHAPVCIELKDTTRRPAPVKTKKTKRPLLVIDGDSFAHRSYHALPKSIMHKGDKPAGAILGFANRLLRFYEDEQPRAVLVAWDTYGALTYRNKAFPAYQSGREFDEALLEQFAPMRQFVDACGFANARGRGYEADDFLAAAVAAEEKRKGTVLVASGDRDTFQLASGKTTILYPVRAGELARIGPAEVEARYGVAPKQVPDFIALRGDPSDKLPGAPGLGADGAAAMLRKYGSLEKALKAGRYSALADKLRLFREIATMDRKAPIPHLPDQKPTWDKAARLARGWQLNKLAERLEALAASRN